jgi:hypothetical protein
LRNDNCLKKEGLKKLDPKEQSFSSKTCRWEEKGKRNVLQKHKSSRQERSREAIYTVQTRRAYLVFKKEPESNYEEIVWNFDSCIA